MDYVKVAVFGNSGLFRGACDPHALSRFVAELPRWIDRLRLRPVLEEIRHLAAYMRSIDTHVIACGVLLLCTVTLVVLTLADLEAEPPSATAIAFMLSACLVATMLLRRFRAKRSWAVVRKHGRSLRWSESPPPSRFFQCSRSAPGLWALRSA